MPPSAAIRLPQPFKAGVSESWGQGCHGGKLQGGGAPALSGASFLKDWQGKPVQELYTVIRTMMPLNKAGSLTDKQALDVTTFVLQANGVKPGKKSMTAATLKTSKVTTK